MTVAIHFEMQLLSDTLFPVMTKASVFARIVYLLRRANLESHKHAGGGESVAYLAAATGNNTSQM